MFLNNFLTIIFFESLLISFYIQENHMWYFPNVGRIKISVYGA